MEIGPLPEAVLAVIDRLKEAGHTSYLVGGCVRDLLRGVSPGDYDIATSARPEEVISLFKKTVPVGISFGVVIVVEGGRNYEVATFRSEDGYGDGRRPSRVTFATAEEDVRRRDFTMNGLLFDTQEGRVIDYVGGQEDIERRIVRTIGNPEARFAEDHLRMLRAVRFAANLNFDIDAETLAAIGRHAGDMGRISAERLRDELTKLLVRGGARRGMEYMAATGLLREILPEVAALRGVEQPPRFHPEGDVWEHTLRMLDLLPAGVEADPRLAWGVLMHDLGKAVTRSVDERGVHFYGHVRQGTELARQVMERLRFSGDERETIMDLVRCHMLFMHVREMRPHRLKRFLRRADFPLHLELHRLDCMGSHGMLDNYAFCRDKLAAMPAEELRPPRLVTGHDLIALGFTPGPLFGEILREVEDAQLNGEIGSPEEARLFIKGRWGGEMMAI